MTTDVKQKKYGKPTKSDLTWGSKLQAKEKKKHNSKTGKFWGA